MLNLKRIHQSSSSNMQQNEEIEDDPPPPSPPNSEPIDIHIEDEEEEREEAESNVTEEAEAGAQSHGCIAKKYFRRDANDKGLYYCLKCPGAKKVRGSNTSNLWNHLEKHHFPIYIKSHSRQKLKEGKKKNQKRTNTASTSSSTSSYYEVEHASENGPKKMKQATILQSFALSKKATESKLSELAMAVLENCKFASVRLFDSPHFKTILECACPAFSSFTSSEDVICHMRAQYELKKSMLIEEVNKSISDATLEFKIRNVCGQDYFTATLIYMTVENKMASVTLDVRKFIHWDQLEQMVQNVMSAKFLQDKVGCIIIGPQPEFLIPAMCATTKHVPVVVCVFSALEVAWEKVQKEIEDIDFYKSRVVPLSKKMFSPSFLALLASKEERDQVTNSRGSIAETLKLLLLYNSLLATVSDEDADLDGLSHRERTIAREITDILSALNKILTSSLLKPDYLHLSLWTTFESLFLASFEGQIKHLKMPDAVTIAELAKQALKDCFSGPDQDTTTYLKLLDLRTKNAPIQDAIVYSNCISRLEAELKRTRKNHNDLAEEERRKESSCEDGLLKTFWETYLSDRCISRGNASTAHFGMSSNLKAYLDETQESITTPTFHEPWLLKSGHELYSVASKYFAIMCASRNKQNLLTRDVSDDEATVMSFVASYPTLL